MFLLFINDICNVSNLLKFVLFADDTNIFCSNENVGVLQDTLNRELAKLFVWFSINKLSLNLLLNLRSPRDCPSLSCRLPSRRRPFAPVVLP